MKTRLVIGVLLLVAGCTVAWLGWAILSAPRHPVALIRVVDATGKPVAGAVIKPDGLRTKAGPYVSGHYGWRTTPNWPTNDLVRTDTQGYAPVPYPKFVFERIETGQISFSVNHPDFVPDRPFRTVTTAPPAGAPWRVWVDYLWNRIRRTALLARPDPVVLQKGAILRISVRESPAPQNALLFALVSGLESEDANFWMRPEPGMILTRRLAPGPRTVQAVQLDAKGTAWFSDLIRITAVTSQTNDLSLALKPGVALHGQLDPTVPRPIINGRVIAHVWPLGEKAEDSPPQWHACTTIREDGSFDLGSLPPGQLEILALCTGFVSTNGPGQFPRMHYPQKQVLGTNDVALTIGMEPTACLAVQVMDDQGNPLKDAHVSTWPNIRYGEWSAVILGQDYYNSAEHLRDGPGAKPWWNRVHNFQATSDVSGLALISDLPMEVKEMTVDHPRFALPAVATGSGQKNREVPITLKPGQTNHVTVHLELREQSPIAHY